MGEALRGWVKENERGIVAWAPRPIYAVCCQPPGRWRRAEARDMALIERFVGSERKRVKYALELQGRGDG